MKLFKRVLALCLVAILLVACGNSEEQEQTEEQGYNWSDAGNVFFDGLNSTLGIAALNSEEHSRAKSLLQSVSGKQMSSATKDKVDALNSYCVEFTEACSAIIGDTESNWWDSVRNYPVLGWIAEMEWTGSLASKTKKVENMKNELKTKCDELEKALEEDDVYNGRAKSEDEDSGNPLMILLIIAVVLGVVVAAVLILIKLKSKKKPKVQAKPKAEKAVLAPKEAKQIAYTHEHAFAERIKKLGVSKEKADEILGHFNGSHKLAYENVLIQSKNASEVDANFNSILHPKEEKAYNPLAEKEGAMVKTGSVGSSKVQKAAAKHAEKMAKLENKKQIADKKAELKSELTKKKITEKSKEEAAKVQAKAEISKQKLENKQDMEAVKARGKVERSTQKLALSKAKHDTKVAREGTKQADAKLDIHTREWVKDNANRRRVETMNATTELTKATSEVIESASKFTKPGFSIHKDKASPSAAANVIDSVIDVPAKEIPSLPPPTGS